MTDQSQGASKLQPQVYVFAHWADPRTTFGKHSGSGYTVVRATNGRVAREMVWQYLCDKPGGNRQCASRNTLELKDSDEVGFVVSSADVSQGHGVLTELALTSGDWSAEPVLVYSANSRPSLLHYDGPGHPKEFVLVVGQFGNSGDKMIPQWFCRQLQELLPDYSVDNRGTRIELTLKVGLGQNSLAAVVRLGEVLAAAKQVFGPVFADNVGVLLGSEKLDL
jgi:hypothetical protein